MRDVEEQLRAYGDAVEVAAGGASLAPEHSTRMRGVLRGALAAAIVLGLVVVGAVLLRDGGSGRRDTSTASTNAHRRAAARPVTAELRLDQPVVYRGEDVLGTVVFHNHTDRTIDLRDARGCPRRWSVQVGRSRPHDAAEFADCAGRGRALTFTPGRTARRVRIPTGVTVCPTGVECSPTRHVGRTRVWLFADAPEIRLPGPVGLRVVGRPTPPFCRSGDLVMTAPRLVARGAAGGDRYQVIVRNPGHTCELVGAPAVTPAADAADAVLPEDHPRTVRLRPGGSASFTVSLARPTACLLGSLSIQLPNGGGTVPLISPFATGPEVGADCAAAVAYRPSNFVPAGPVFLRPARPSG